ncbi:hypothetical protein ACKKBF_B18755 [Auxenochlorella protothecoides x Auxenochlorella symbiontica]
MCSGLADPVLRSKRKVSTRKPVDCAAPILAQVKQLSAASYHAWVHSPVPGQPRFFASDALECLTKVQWWLVPLLWIPVACAWLAVAVRDWGLPTSACYAAAGALSWQGVEYGLHRWVFHARPHSPAAVCAHFLLHGCHHKFPQDVDRLVFPPLPAALIAAGLYYMIRLALPAGGSDAFFGGLLLGYVRYDCMHYLMHSGRLGGRLKAAHMHHHYSNPEEAFGISGGSLDWVLGTRAAIGATRRSLVDR